MTRTKKTVNFKNIDSLDIIAMQESFCTSTMNYNSEIERLLKQLEDAKARQRSAEAEYVANRTKALQSYFNKFITEIELDFKDRALIFGAILYLKAEAEDNPNSNLVLSCYNKYAAYVNDSNNRWVDKDYLPESTFPVKEVDNFHEHES